MDLFEECFEVLGPQASIIQDIQEQEKLISKLVELFPLTSWGRIDWNNVEKKQTINSIEELIPILKKRKKAFDCVYIIWDDGGIPTVQSNLQPIVEHLEDVIAVALDTWIYCPSEGWVVEFHHDGEITLGFE